MNLHENKELFGQYILATADYLGLRDAGIITKDYFITLLLKTIVEKLPGIIFKGGTSLSKCHKLINRFSEDIDLCMNVELGRFTEGQRKNLSKILLL